jgi:hypothetical protein
MLDSLALALSVFAFALLAAFVTDCARRDARLLPLADRMPAPLSGRPLRALWITALAVTFVAGLYGLPVRERRDVREGAAEGPVGMEAHRTLRLPFYVREDRVATAFDGSLVRSSRTTRTQVPWQFLAVVTLYGVGVATRGGRGSRAPGAGSSEGAGIPR